MTDEQLALEVIEQIRDSENRRKLIDAQVKPGTYKPPCPIIGEKPEDIQGIVVATLQYYGFFERIPVVREKLKHCKSLDEILLTVKEFVVIV